MNYLGHAVFSPKDDYVTLGNLSGDFLKNRFHHLLSPAVINGVYLHRAIDTFTDNHQALRELLPLFRPHFGKYSSVVLDVLLDYLIGEIWDDLFNHDFEEFCGSIYQTIECNSKELPERPALIMSRMAAADWLAAYREEERILRVFSRLSDKARIELKGRIALDVFTENRDLLVVKGMEFLSDLKNYLTDNKLINEPRIIWKKEML